MPCVKIPTVSVCFKIVCTRLVAFVYCTSVCVRDVGCVKLVRLCSLSLSLSLVPCVPRAQHHLSFLSYLSPCACSPFGPPLAPSLPTSCSMVLELCSFSLSLRLLSCLSFSSSFSVPTTEKRRRKRIVDMSEDLRIRDNESLPEDQF